MKKFMNFLKEKPLFAALIGLGGLLVILLLTGIFGLAAQPHGIGTAARNFFGVLGNPGINGFAFVVELLSILVLVAAIVFAIIKKKFILIAPAVLFAALVAYIGFLANFVSVDRGNGNGPAVAGFIIALLLTLCDGFIVAMPLLVLFKKGEKADDLDDDDAEDLPEEDDAPVEEPVEEEAPVEEPVEEEPVEEPVEEEPVEEEKE